MDNYIIKHKCTRCIPPPEVSFIPAQTFEKIEPNFYYTSYIGQHEDIVKKLLNQHQYRHPRLHFKVVSINMLEKIKPAHYKEINFYVY